MFVGLVTRVTTIDGQWQIRMPNHPSSVAVLDTMSQQDMTFGIRSPECSLLLRRVDEIRRRNLNSESEIDGFDGRRFLFLGLVGI